MSFHKVKIETDVSNFSFNPKKKLVRNESPKRVSRLMSVTGSEINALVKECKAEFSNLNTENMTDKKYLGSLGFVEVKEFENKVVQTLYGLAGTSHYIAYRAMDNINGIWGPLVAQNAASKIPSVKGILWDSKAVTPIAHTIRVESIKEGHMDTIEAVMDGVPYEVTELLYAVSDISLSRDTYVEFSLLQQLGVSSKITVSEGDLSASSNNGTPGHKSVSVIIAEKMSHSGSYPEYNGVINYVKEALGVIKFGIERSGNDIYLHHNSVSSLIHQGLDSRDYPIEFSSYVTQVTGGSSVKLVSDVSAAPPLKAKEKTLSLASAIVDTDIMEERVASVEKEIEAVKVISPPLGYFNEVFAHPDNNGRTLIPNRASDVKGKIETDKVDTGATPVSVSYNKLIPNSSYFKFTLNNPGSLYSLISLSGLAPNGQMGVTTIIVDPFSAGKSIIVNSQDEWMNVNSQPLEIIIDKVLNEPPLEFYFEALEDGRVYLTVGGVSHLVFKQLSHMKFETSTSTSGMGRISVSMQLEENPIEYVPKSTYSVPLLNATDALYIGLEPKIVSEMEGVNVKLLPDGRAALTEEKKGIAPSDLWLGEIKNSVFLNKNVDWNLNETPNTLGSFSSTGYVFSNSVDLGNGIFEHYGHPASIFDHKLVPGSLTELSLIGLPVSGLETLIGLFTSKDKELLDVPDTYTLITRKEDGQLIASGLDPDLVGFNTANGATALPVVSGDVTIRIEYTLSREIYLHVSGTRTLISKMPPSINKDLILGFAHVAIDVPVPCSVNIVTNSAFNTNVEDTIQPLGSVLPALSVIDSLPIIRKVSSLSNDVVITEREGEVELNFIGNYVSPELLYSAIEDKHRVVITEADFTDVVHVDKINDNEGIALSGSLLGTVSEGVYVSGGLDCFIGNRTRFSLNIPAGLDSGLSVKIFFSENGIDSLDAKNGVSSLSLNKGVSPNIQLTKDMVPVSSIEAIPLDGHELHFENTDAGLMLVDALDARHEICAGIKRLRLEVVMTGTLSFEAEAFLNLSPIARPGEAPGITPLLENLTKTNADNRKRVKTQEAFAGSNADGLVSGGLIKKVTRRILNVSSRGQGMEEYVPLPYTYVNPDNTNALLEEYSMSTTRSDTLLDKKKCTWGTEAISVPKGCVTFLKVWSVTFGEFNSKIFFVDSNTPTLDRVLILNELAAEGTVERVIRFAGEPDVVVPPKPLSGSEYFYIGLSDNELFIVQGETNPVLIDTKPMPGPFHVLLECLRCATVATDVKEGEVEGLMSTIDKPDLMFVPTKAAIKRREVTIRHVEAVDTRARHVSDIKDGFSDNRVIPFDLATEQNTSYLSVPDGKSATTGSLIKFSDSTDGKAVGLELSKTTDGVKSKTTRFKSNNNVVIGKYNGANVIVGDKMGVITSVVAGTVAGSVRFNIPPVLDAEADYVFTVQLLDDENKRVVIDQQLDHVTVSVYVSGVLTDTPFRFRIDFD